MGAVARSEGRALRVRLREAILEVTPKGQPAFIGVGEDTDLVFLCVFFFFFFPLAFLILILVFFCDGKVFAGENWGSQGAAADVLVWFIPCTRIVHFSCIFSLSVFD